jgi:hypothetical protein
VTRILRWVLCTALAVPCATALAHKPSDSYLSLRVDKEAIEGQWDIALRDIDFALGLDADGNGEITWGELRSKHAQLSAYALSRLALTADGARCELEPREHLVDEHSDGAYAVLRFTARCAVRTQIDVEYSLFFDLDPTHRGLLRIDQGGASLTGVLGPDEPRREFSLAAANRVSQFFDYLREGTWHIWIGFDHILFLVSLLLPAVLLREARAWRPTERFAPAFWDVFRIVTSFTIAHSITLTLAALSVVELPSRLVESAIALSVVLAALNNLYPIVTGRRWIVAFGFGLIHGFGFASVLTDLGLPKQSLLLALVGFNLGVEVGQLAIVAGFLPIAYLLRSSWLYRRLVFGGGSALVVLVASVWLFERAFDFKL